jgi:hypothetical protein
MNTELDLTLVTRVTEEALREKLNPYHEKGYAVSSKEILTSFDDGTTAYRLVLTKEGREI